MAPQSDLEPVLVFLSALRVNNRKEWFDLHKAEYEAAREQFALLLEAVMVALGDLEELKGLDPRKCIHRIYRDLRFSKDKTPYNTAFSATLPPWKQRSSAMPYYFHIEPGGLSMVAGGLHAPTPGQLARFRAAAALDAAPLKEAAAEPEFRRLFGELRGESLKSVPRDYPREHPEVDLLRRKELTAICLLSDAEVLQEGLAERLAAACRAMRPVLTVLYEMAGPPEFI